MATNADTIPTVTVHHTQLFTPGTEREAPAMNLDAQREG